MSTPVLAKGTERDLAKTTTFCRRPIGGGGEASGKKKALMKGPIRVRRRLFGGTLKGCLKSPPKFFIKMGSIHQ